MAKTKVTITLEVDENILDFTDFQMRAISFLEDMVGVDEDTVEVVSG